jgi:hypothetical protein
VVLSQLDGEEGSDYINANHIDVRILLELCILLKLQQKLLQLSTKADFNAC